MVSDAALNESIPMAVAKIHSVNPVLRNTLSSGDCIWSCLFLVFVGQTSFHSQEEYWWLHQMELAECEPLFSLDLQAPLSCGPDSSREAATPFHLKNIKLIFLSSTSHVKMLVSSDLPVEGSITYSAF